MQFSYYYLRLQSYLRYSHPHLLADSGFIANRVDIAATTYELERLNGSSHDDAMEQVSEVLFKGLHFSIHDTIALILEELYPLSADNEKHTRKVANHVYSQIDLDKYKIYRLDDNFEQTEEYRLFYVELLAEVYHIVGDYGF